MTPYEAKQFLRPGVKVLIGDSYWESPTESLDKYLGTIQTVRLVEVDDYDDEVSVFIEGESTHFFAQEIECVVSECIDESVESYEPGDISLLFSEVSADGG